MKARLNSYVLFFIIPVIFLGPVFNFKIAGVSLDFASIGILISSLYVVIIKRKLKYPILIFLCVLVINFLLATFSFKDLTRYILHGILVLLAYATTWTFVRKDTVDYILKKYLHLSYYFVLLNFIVIIGYYLDIKWLYDFSYLNENYKLSKGIFDFLPRFSSVYTEPAHYIITILPLFLFSFDNLIQRKYKFKDWVVFFGVIVSQSSLLFLAILIFLLFRISLNAKILYRLPFIGMFAYFIYVQNEQFKTRIDDIIFVGQHLDNLKEINLSSFALINNAIVAYESIKLNLFGNGFGLHYLGYEKFSLMWGNVEKDINNFDGASLILRLISELGILGIIIISFLFYKGFNVRTRSKEGLFLFITLIIFFIRSGHYFLFGLPLIIVSILILSNGKKA